MVLKAFKARSNQKYVEKLLATRIPSVNDNKVSSVGVILHLDEFSNFEQFRSFFKSIDLRPNRVKIIAYSYEEPTIDKLWDSYFNAKDFGWKGNINNTELETFLNQPFDLLISYYKKPELELDLITAKSTANFKVGLSTEDPRLYDLIIDLDTKQFDLFTKELIKYLKVLNKLQPESKVNA